jgi:hypothetical protein
MLTPDSFIKNKKGVYVPIPKGKGFSPNPVAVNGIPFFADSLNNADAVGSKQYSDYWDEQYDRCVNGYETGGIFIPGRYYYYLNFTTLNGLYGPQFPWISDLDLEYFLTVDWIKEKKKAGLISIKARRKGLSEKFQAIANHGVRFIEGYKAGIAAGIQKYSDGLREKFKAGFDNVIPEMSLNYTNYNDQLFQAGYEEKTESGSYKLGGYRGQLKFATMHDKAEKLEGEYFNDVALEECGQFEKARDTHDSIKPALEFGSKMEGTFYIYGTGGNILSTSKDFQFLWEHAESYDLVKLWVPGRRMYFPFYVNNIKGVPVNPKTKEEDYEIDPETEEKIDPIENLRKFKPYERIGMEDVESASAFIKKKKIALANLPDKSALIKYNKSYPETEEEAWSSGGNNNFDGAVLNNQLVNLMTIESQLKEYVLDWVYETEKDGRKVKKIPLEVTPRLAKREDPDYKKHLVYQEPMPGFKNLDVMGIDSYNQDETKTSKSLGAAVVLRRYDVLLGYSGNLKGKVPVHMYYKRPKRKELFYEESLKAAVWYGLTKNVMISAEYDNIIGYWKENYGKQYLSSRPRSFESKNSKQEHKYGAKMTGHSKPLALGIAQSWVLDNYKYIFYPELIRDFIAYDEEIIESDWDAADAVMLALMRIEDMRRNPTRIGEQSANQHYSGPEYELDSDGEIIVKDLDEKKEITKEDLENMNKGYVSSSNNENEFVEDDPFDHIFE